MRPHAVRQAKRLATRATNAKNARERKRYKEHAARWTAYAMESDSERECRRNREMRAAREQAAALDAKRALQRIAKAERIAQWQARNPKPRSRADREIILKKKPTLIGMHISKRELRQLRQENRADQQRQREAIVLARRAGKRAAARLPPLPY